MDPARHLSEQFAWFQEQAYARAEATGQPVVAPGNVQADNARRARARAKQLEAQQVATEDVVSHQTKSLDGVENVSDPKRS